MLSIGAKAPDSPRSPGRRRFIAACVGGAASGAAWTTGFSLLVRGRHPQLFVVGANAWQVALIEHGSRRILVLNGEFERSPEPEINRLCSVLRQHIDIVAGTRSALSFLSNGFRERRGVDVVVQLDGPHNAPSSPGFIPLTQSMAIGAGDIALQLRPLPTTGMDHDNPGATAWIANVQVGGLIVALAPSTEVIAHHGGVDSTLAIAAGGDVGILQRYLPGAASAVNAQAANGFTSIQTGDNSGAQSWLLVRVFPADIAAFIFRDKRLVLPGWTQRIGNGDA